MVGGLSRTLGSSPRPEKAFARSGSLHGHQGQALDGKNSIVISDIIAAALAVLTASVAPAIGAESPEHVTAHAASWPPVDTQASSAHYWDDQRYDVPNDLLRSRGVLINGFGPQAVQFD